MRHQSVFGFTNSSSGESMLGVGSTDESFCEEVMENEEGEQEVIWFLKIRYIVVRMLYNDLKVI